jgi:uncharacterized protein
LSVYLEAGSSRLSVRRWSAFGALLTASIVGVRILAQAGIAHRPVYADALAIFGSALASSVAGFAFSALVGAFLFRDGGTPQHTLQIIVLSSIAIQLFSTASLWRSIRWRPLCTFLIGGALGLPVGIFLLNRVTTAAYMRGMGLFLLAYGAYVLLSRPLVVRVGPKRAALIDAFTGILGGITGGLAGFPGAFVTIWCGQRGWDKTRQRAVFQPYIVIMQVATLMLLSVTARPAGERAALFNLTALAFVPVALTGAYLGLVVFRRLSDGQFARILSLMLIASGIGLTGVL